MTKEELVAVVDRVYASWNQQVPASGAKSIYLAWWVMLHDLTVVETDKAVDRLVIRNSWMPRPGEVRRLVIGSDNLTPPAPLEAWQQLRNTAEAVNAGTYVETVPHPCLKETLDRLGGAAGLSLNTNGDREQFMRLYAQVVEDWEIARFSPPPAP